MFVHVYENQLISMSEHLEVYAFESINASEWKRIRKRKDTRPCTHTRRALYVSDSFYYLGLPPGCTSNMDELQP